MIDERLKRIEQKLGLVPIQKDPEWGCPTLGHAWKRTGVGTYYGGDSESTETCGRCGKKRKVFVHEFWGKNGKDWKTTYKEI